jgi:hypothetical protein
MAVILLPPAARPPSDVGSAEAAVIVRTERRRTGPLAALLGELDLSARPILSDALSTGATPHAGDVVVDLAEVKFIDSAIVRALPSASACSIAEAVCSRFVRHQASPPAFCIRSGSAV